MYSFTCISLNYSTKQKYSYISLHSETTNKNVSTLVSKSVERKPLAPSNAERKDSNTNRHTYHTHPQALLTGTVSMEVHRRGGGEKRERGKNCDKQGSWRLN